MNTGNGWQARRTLAAPPDRLYRATVNSLDVCLSDKPSVLELQLGGLSLTLSIPSTYPLVYRVCAHGLRATGEVDQQQVVASCFKPEPGVVLFEADEVLWPVVLENGGQNHPAGQENVWSHGKHHLVMLTVHIATARRMVLLAGTGQPEQLIARARTYTDGSAHQQLDTAFREFQSDSHVHKSLDFLLSRLRPASPLIPYPWFAGSDGEPVWNAGTVYLLAHAMMEHEPGIAAGLINNLVELMDQEGNQPAFGGHAHEMIMESPAHPLLLRLYAHYHRVMTTWPGELERAMPTLDAYLVRVIEQTTAAKTNHHVDLLNSWLASQEIVCWEQMQLHLVGTRESAKRVRAQLHSMVAPAAPNQPSNEKPTWLRLLDHRTTSDKHVEHSIRAYLDGAPTESVISLDSPNATTSNLLLLMIAEELKTTDHERTDDWTRRMIERETGQSIATTRVDDMEHLMESVALSVWASAQQPLNKSGLKKQPHASMVWLNRKRRWLTAAAVVLLSIGLVWLIRIQSRPTMPTSVYEASMGVALQHYQSGRMDMAMEKLLEMEDRGAKNHAGLQFVKGKVYFRLKEYDKAIECFEYAARARPGNVAPEFNIGLCLFHKKEYQNAAAMFEALSRRLARTQPTLAMKARRAAEIAAEFEQVNLGKPGNK